MKLFLGLLGIGAMLLCVECLGFHNPRAQQIRHPGFEKDSSAIVSIAQQLLDAVGRGDTNVWKRYLHPDCIIRTEDGALKRKKDMLSEIRPLPTGYDGTITVTNPVLVPERDVVILSFIADEHLSVYGQAIHTAYAETDTYVKSASGWLLLASEVFELPGDPPRVNVKTDLLQSYVGVYQLAKGVENQIILAGDSLMAQRTGRRAMELVPETESVFFTPGQRGRKIFVKDDTGKVIKMIDRRNGHDLVWTKLR